MYAKLQTSLPLLAFKFSCNSRNSSYELLRFSGSSDADGCSKGRNFRSLLRLPVWQRSIGIGPSFPHQAKKAEQMLRITIDLVPGGIELESRAVASMQISNVSDLADCSDYHVEITETVNPLTGDPARKAECMVVAHHRRTEGLGPLGEGCCEFLKDASNSLKS